jgi:hypothetical protein
MLYKYLTFIRIKVVCEELLMLEHLKKIKVANSSQNSLVIACDILAILKRNFSTHLILQQIQFVLFFFRNCQPQLRTEMKCGFLNV